MAQAASPGRQALVRQAIILESLIILYNLAEGILSVLAGIAAGSVVLVGFGLDSAIEVSAAVVVVFHLSRSGAERQPVWERGAATFVGATLLLLAIYVVARSVYALAASVEPGESYLGVGITLASVVVMPIVSRLQKRYAVRIDSQALAADSKETLVCTYLSAAALAGLGLNALLGWWWADPVAALAISVMIVKEGREILVNRELLCVD